MLRFHRLNKGSVGVFGAVFCSKVRFDSALEFERTSSMPGGGISALNPRENLSDGTRTRDPGWYRPRIRHPVLLRRTSTTAPTLAPGQRPTEIRTAPFGQPQPTPQSGRRDARKSFGVTFGGRCFSRCAHTAPYDAGAGAALPESASDFGASRREQPRMILRYGQSFSRKIRGT